MGFKFVYLCDLLSSLERNRHLKAASSARSQNTDFHILSNWCLNHSKRIHDKDTDLGALLSCLFPEKRPDRVYGFQSAALARIIARCLYLGISRIKDLDKWRVQGEGDLGQCVENVMRQAENQIIPGQEVTIEEIDAVLDDISSRCRFSGPSVRKRHAAAAVDEILGPLYRKLGSRDSKWLTRLILKSYHPVKIPMDAALKNIHFLLPQLLLFQNSFEAAVYLLKSTPLKYFPRNPPVDSRQLLNEKAIQHLVPQPGVKVGRPDYYKARSIKHCCSIISRRRMSLERKYDGEYCQIHIDMTRGADCIQIFSKSGKDSTADRAAIHHTIKQSLRLSEKGCKISHRCILEGELLVWSDKDGKILDFNKLRKFIMRSGTFIGTEYDSQPKPYEHLMIVFFDILLLDSDVCLSKPHRMRRLMLKETVNPIPGRAGISEQEIIDFSRSDASRRLQIAFSKCIAERWEGYVLKGCDEPYFAILSPGRDHGFCRWIKLKKDYIPGLGDTADLSLIGARYESKDAQYLSNIRNLSWTHFYIGCLENKHAVIQSSARARYRVVDIIGRHSLCASDMQLLNKYGKFIACDVESNMMFDIHSIHNSLPEMDIAFKTPFIVELLGSGFERPSNAQYYTLRFPRVLKIHWDRTYEDAVSFSELQDLAEKARSVPTQMISEESSLWYEKVEATHGRSEYIVEKSQTSTSSVSISIGTPTPLGKQSTLTSTTLTPPTSKETEEGSSHSKKAFANTKNFHTNFYSVLQSSITKRSAPSTLLASQASLKRRKALKPSPAMDRVEEESLVLHQSLRARGSPVPIFRFPGEEFCTMSSSQSHQARGQVADKEALKENSNPSPKQPPASVQPDIVDVSKNGPLVNCPTKLAASLPLLMATPDKENTNEESLGQVENHLMVTDAIPITRILPAYLESPLLTIPMYCGDFGFVESLFRAAPRDFTFSMAHFVHSLGTPLTRENLRASNPSAVDSNIALGIAIINKRDPANTLAAQLYNIGNLVAASLQNESIGFPTRGKIFFLDRNILTAENGVHDETLLLNDWWAVYGTMYYYATISWGFGMDLDQFSQRVDEACELGAQAVWYDLRRTTTVINLYEPSDVEIIGEFVSIDPVVHIRGDYFHSPGRFTRSLSD
ncbi:hypothetical protein BGW36DRAFT_356138 [Talaromyces proteolyticus]|uniref:ATP-dependent DNA ligase family profile domain-containing protein n=1 Tax=Talaromyces proteolyticus TaxID=1131652 RepID=A0AAD4Q3P4_9EURO|nr:uncharacterized protein BGW36DRAFT_356138 [Talaromyces proteolyticus]KAH8701993.1 hypothetical protein BGW36DRAFT_356138 [Talaromyces proteolyticus]